MARPASSLTALRSLSRASDLMAASCTSRITSTRAEVEISLAASGIFIRATLRSPSARTLASGSWVKVCCSTGSAFFLYDAQMMRRARARRDQTGSLLAIFHITWRALAFRLLFMAFMAALRVAGIGCFRYAMTFLSPRGRGSPSPMGASRMSQRTPPARPYVVSPSRVAGSGSHTATRASTGLARAPILDRVTAAVWRTPTSGSVSTAM